MLYDKDIREPLFDWFLEHYGKVRALEEKIIGKSRADMVFVLPDAICGVEIKSDADSYARLESQVKDYDRFFDVNYVVAGSSHGMHISEHVPSYWGIITVEETEAGIDFYMLREPEQKTGVTWPAKLSFLWRPELASLLEALGLPKYRERSKPFVIEKITAATGVKVMEDAVKKEYLRLLFERDYTAIEDIISAFKKEQSLKKAAKRSVNSRRAVRVRVRRKRRSTRRI